MNHNPIRTVALPRSPLLPAAAIIVLSLMGATVAVAERLPYGFGGHGHADNVLGDFISGGGTALSPPLPTLIIVAALAALSRRTGSPGRFAKLALIPVAAAFVIAIVGEPLTQHALSPAHFEPFKATLIILALITSVTIGITAAGSVRRTRHIQSDETQGGGESSSRITANQPTGLPRITQPADDTRAPA
jgi:hypothetical protein